MIAICSRLSPFMSENRVSSGGLRLGDGVGGGGLD